MLPGVCHDLSCYIGSSTQDNSPLFGPCQMLFSKSSSCLANARPKFPVQFVYSYAEMRQVGRLTEGLSMRVSRMGYPKRGTPELIHKGTTLGMLPQSLHELSVPYLGAREEDMRNLEYLGNYVEDVVSGISNKVKLPPVRVTILLLRCEDSDFQ
ncbi:conserved hypothetical protein [Ricinus communis]|uniref:Uncharacterized protein n=1 Tax=Ricinus communis TaxID=3988 RepID=B9RGQ4_RICCO|nr:conserved hypothetical protein [Ricinus communis]